MAKRPMTGHIETAKCGGVAARSIRFLLHHSLSSESEATVTLVSTLLVGLYWLLKSIYFSRLTASKFFTQIYLLGCACSLAIMKGRTFKGAVQPSTRTRSSSSNSELAKIESLQRRPSIRGARIQNLPKLKAFNGDPVFEEQ
ncbi:hypothetical protein OsJ_21212 [Oryza sativa Japonica Group]|uniref:Uncharacterized protein n=1 Tax=Oryza sativa subsp. japonica TaxID=39947 RepID=B9FT29_ORYSJ|nr:hypothetical protein OsJ_21212 [Oryza sativa Japonica Group]